MSNIHRRHVVRCIALCLFIGEALEASAQVATRFTLQGTTDQSFATQPSLLSQGVGRETARDAKNRIVLVGTGNNNFRVARLNPNGSVDTTFGGDGLVETSFSGDAEALAVAIRTNGWILVAGTVFSNNQNDFAVACYTAHGDPCPGNWGSLPGARIQTSFSAGARGRSIAVAPNGSFVVAGWVEGASGANGAFALARYSSTGELDLGFGIGGKVELDLFPISFLHDVAFDETGDIVAAGSFRPEGVTEPRFVVLRFAPNGNWDTTFGQNGMATPFVGCNPDWGGCIFESSAFAVAVDSEGRIVAGGYANPFPGGNRPILTRLLPTGATDPDFGYVILPPHGASEIYDISVPSDDSIWISGHQALFPFIGHYTSDGDVDTAFGGTGFIRCGTFPQSTTPSVVVQHFKTGRKPVLIANGPLLLADGSCAPTVF